MRITVEIKGADYNFELDRSTYKMLLQDEEYAKMQNELVKQIGKSSDTEKATEKLVENDITKAMLTNLITCEKTFYFSLKKHHPEMTKELASELLDSAIEEYGYGEVQGLVSDLTQNFTLMDNSTEKKKMKKIVN
jgi:hypothetical protein